VSSALGEARRRRGVARWVAVCWFVVVTVPEAIAVRGGRSQPDRAGSGFSLRFYGHGRDGIDRVVIPLDGRPVNVGQNLTIEFWMRANGDDNASPPCQEGGDGWIFGNILIDRDVFGPGDLGDFGVSLGGGRIAFGVAVGDAAQTICSDTPIADDTWHHVALTRAADGRLRIFVDGRPSGDGRGAPGDISYRSGRATPYGADPTLVFGAEKHDAGSEYPSFNGWLDEVRISSTVRYTVPFMPARVPFSPDGQTVALYHFDEGPAGPCRGDLADSSAATGGGGAECRHGGSAPAGPEFSSDTPIAR